MAKVKTKVRYWEMTEKLAPGLRIADVKKKVGEVKDSVFKVVVAEHNNAGVLAIIKHLSAILPADGPDGPAWVANVVNTAIATSISGMADAAHLDKTLTTVPKFQKFGEVDKGAVAGKMVQDAINALAGTPSKEDLDKLVRDVYAGMVL